MKKTSLLKAYRDRYSMQQSEFAKQLGISASLLSLLESGRRKVSPDRAVSIEKKTKGGLTRKDLRPDIFA